MKTLALVAALAVVSANQADRPSIAGSWTAQFEGRTFLRLELAAANGTITGGLTVGDIEVDEQGGLRRVGEPPRDPTPIFDVTEHASTVTFAWKNGSDTDRFEMRVLQPGRAELRLVLDDADRQELAAIGVQPPKPIPLTKQSARKDAVGLDIVIMNCASTPTPWRGSTPTSSARACSRCGAAWARS